MSDLYKNAFDHCAITEEPKMRSYTPGQRLNTAAEVAQALLDYKEVVDADGFRWQMERGLVVMKNTMAAMYNPVFDANKVPFTVYTPPKRKVKREVSWWFNIYETYEAAFGTEEQARDNVYGRTVAVAVPHSFTLEVEVEE